MYYEVCLLVQAAKKRSEGRITYVIAVEQKMLTGSCCVSDDEALGIATLCLVKFGCQESRKQNTLPKQSL